MRRYAISAVAMPAGEMGNHSGAHAIRMIVSPLVRGECPVVVIDFGLEDAEALEGQLVAARETFRVAERLERASLAAGEVMASPEGSA